MENKENTADCSKQSAGEYMMDEIQQEKFKKSFYEYAPQMEKEMNQVITLLPNTLSCFYSSIREIIREKYVRRAQLDAGVDVEKLMPYQNQNLVKQFDKPVEDMGIEDFKDFIYKYEKEIKKSCNKDSNIVILDYVKSKKEV